MEKEEVLGAVLTQIISTYVQSSIQISADNGQSWTGTNCLQLDERETMLLAVWK